MRAAIARPVPVLPEVGSMIVPPGFRRPSASAAWKHYAPNQSSQPTPTTDGVRRIIRGLDLQGVELASMRLVVDQFIAWARDT